MLAGSFISKLGPSGFQSGIKTSFHFSMCLRSHSKNMSSSLIWLIVYTLFRLRNTDTIYVSRFKLSAGSPVTFLHDLQLQGLTPSHLLLRGWILLQRRREYQAKQLSLINYTRLLTRRLRSKFLADEFLNRSTHCNISSRPRRLVVE